MVDTSQASRIGGEAKPGPEQSQERNPTEELSSMSQSLMDRHTFVLDGVSQPLSDLAELAVA